MFSQGKSVQSPVALQQMGDLVTKPLLVRPWAIRRYLGPENSGNGFAIHVRPLTAEAVASAPCRGVGLVEHQHGLLHLKNQVDLARGVCFLRRGHSLATRAQSERGLL